MGRATKVAIWASELKAGSLPPVCVKSGQAADSNLTFRFVTASGGSIFVSVLTTFSTGVDLGWSGRRARGPLPLTKQWRRRFLALRGVPIALAATAIVALLSTGSVPLWWGEGLLALAVGSFLACLVVLVIYAGLKPKGYVYLTTDRQLWVALEGVHPNFVDAVNTIGH